MSKCMPSGVSGEDEMTEEGALLSPLETLVLSRCMAGGIGRLPCTTGELSGRAATGCTKDGSMAGEIRAGAMEVIACVSGCAVMT